MEKNLKPVKKRWSVYMVRCADNSLYTGISNDVAKRVKAHNAGKGAKYTRMRIPVRLIYTREIGSMSAAMKREYSIKKNGKKYKESLIRLFNSRKKLKS